LVKLDKKVVEEVIETVVEGTSKVGIEST